jgi:hypothetical protein
MHPINPDRLKPLALILVAVLIFMLGVTSATAGWIKIQGLDFAGFLPSVMKNADTSTTVAASEGALVVFSSAAVTDGNGGGRAPMNNICFVQDPASHFCSVIEIETAWMYRGVRFQNPFTRAWVDNPILGEVIRNQVTGTGARSIWETNTICNGWTTNNSGYEGTWIDDGGKKLNYEWYGAPPGTTAWCNEVHPVACCK